jgi:LuxR family transcriptional regulator, quorum-sensing system regulator SolR
MEGVARSAVSLDGEEFAVAGTASLGRPRFWVERKDGTRWLDISACGPTHSTVFNPARHIVALTGLEQGSLVELLGMRSGWFRPTGQQIEFPPGRTNDLWEITPLAVDALAAVGAELCQPDLCRPPPGGDIDVVMRHWIEKLRAVHVGAVVVTVADPFSVIPGGRLVVVTHPQELRKRSHHFEAPAMRPAKPPLVEWAELKRNSARAWERMMAAEGFRMIVTIRLPAGGHHHLEIHLFGEEHFYRRAQAATAVWSTLEVAQGLKEAIAGFVCNLTPRERDCLELAAAGLSTSELGQALDCTARTAQYHLNNAMAKLKTSNKTAAVYRALMLGII